MRRGWTPLLSPLVALAMLAPSAGASVQDYGIESVNAELSTAKGGEHPDFTVAFSLVREGGGQLPSATRDITFDLPPGLLPNPTAVPACTLAQFTSTNVEEPDPDSGCPQASQVGITEVEALKNGGIQRFNEPVYNISPAAGEPARLGFYAISFPILLSTRIRPEDEYGGTGAAEGISSLVPLLAASTELWAVPASSPHDSQRITPYEAVSNGGVPETPNGKRAAGIAAEPFMLNPTRCDVNHGVAFTAIPYAEPNAPRHAFAPLEPNKGCGLLGFEPDMGISPTTGAAQSGAGLNVSLSFPTEGFENPSMPIDSAMRSARVTLPEGLTVNPSQAVGLAACSEGQLAAETVDSAPGQGCPQASKIGSLNARTPLLDEPIGGSLYLATPYENPFHTLVALYMVVKSPERGVIVKLPMRVDIDPANGRLTATVDNVPQLPVSSIELSFRSGARAPLVTPERCGTYVASAALTAWGGQAETLHPSFAVTAGPGGSPCPNGAGPFAPDFEAGSLNNNAGSYSPFYARVARDDAEQQLRSFSASLPPGVTAKLAGVSQCPAAAIAAAAIAGGRAEAAAPSCPSSSRIGGVRAGAGVGSVLTYANGDAYLAGPYRGAPLSAVAVVPAIAGPFDLGTVVTRLPLRLNPRTGVVSVDGSDDPVPAMLAGIPLRIREALAFVDRPQFALNPTSCDPLQTSVQLSSLAGALASATARYQAANCSRLGFDPRLSMKLEGGTQRGAHPALRVGYRPRPRQANLAGLGLRLPRSAFLEQAHIRTICTRVQFAAKTCPKRAIYGRAVVSTPLLDKPLRGPVYLRSSNHKLPDLVAALHGTVDVEVVARIDSVDGGIRATVTRAPDAPISKAVFSMQGGDKGLIVNSTDLCRTAHRASAQLEAHNAKRKTLHPLLRVDCGA